MTLSEFHDHADKKKCPVCNGSNLQRNKNTHNYIVLNCSDCNGVPCFCDGTVFIDKSLTSHFNSGDCSRCNSPNISANDHAYLGFLATHAPSWAK